MIESTFVRNLDVKNLMYVVNTHSYLEKAKGKCQGMRQEKKIKTLSIKYGPYTCEPFPLLFDVDLLCLSGSFSFFLSFSVFQALKNM